MMYKDFFSREMVQLDSVRPLLDTAGTRNLALVTAALQGGSKGGPITLKGVPTQVTITLPEDVTIQPAVLGLFKAPRSATSQLAATAARRSAAAKRLAAKTAGGRTTALAGGTGMSKDKWGYAGTWGYAPTAWPAAATPNAWGDIEGNELCRLGRAQSPIDIVSSKAVGAAELPALKWTCKGAPCAGDGVVRYDAATESKVREFYDGHFFTADNFGADGPPKVTVDGAEYSLDEVHFHTPSEHTLGGKYFDLEMQLMHSTPEGRTLGVAVLLQTGDGSDGPGWLSELASVITPCHLSSDATACKLSASPTLLASKFEFKQVAVTLEPLLNHYYRYTGSITNPPCTEDVEWVVVRVPVEVSQDDWTAIAALQGKNNRPLQPLNGRVVSWV